MRQVSRDGSGFPGSPGLDCIGQEAGGDRGRGAREGLGPCRGAENEERRCWLAEQGRSLK